jgi:hypothetical protein
VACVEGDDVQGILNIRGQGEWHDALDFVHFGSVTELQSHFVRFRLPEQASYMLSPFGKGGELTQLVESEQSFCTKGGGT